MDSLVGFVLSNSRLVDVKIAGFLLLVDLYSLVDVKIVGL